MPTRQTHGSTLRDTFVLFDDVRKQEPTTALSRDQRQRLLRSGQKGLQPHLWRRTCLRLETKGSAKRAQTSSRSSYSSVLPPSRVMLRGRPRRRWAPTPASFLPSRISVCMYTPLLCTCTAHAAVSAERGLLPACRSLTRRAACRCTRSYMLLSSSSSCTDSHQHALSARLQPVHHHYTHLQVHCASF